MSILRLAPTLPIYIPITHTHTASLQKYLEPICTNDSPCLMHFMEDEAGYSFGGREGGGGRCRDEVLCRTASRPPVLAGRFFSKGLGPVLGPTVM